MGGPRCFDLWSDDVVNTRVGTPSPNFHTTPTEAHLTHDRFNMQQAQQHNGFSMEVRLEPTTI